MALKGMHPILNSSDLPTLLSFLTERAGFTFLWDVKDEASSKPVYAGLSLEGSELHASQADSTPAGMQVYFEVDDVDATYADLKAKGAEPTEPEDQFYGMRDFVIKGPEGTVIGFGAQIASEAPSP